MLDIIIRTLRPDYKKKNFIIEYSKKNINTLYTDIKWDTTYE